MQMEILKKITISVLGRSALLYLLFFLGLLINVNFRQAQANWMNSWKRLEPEVVAFEKSGSRPSDTTFRILLRYYTKLNHWLPKEGLIWNNIGACQYYLGKHRESLESFQRAMDLAPGIYIPVWDRGMIYYRLGDFDNARIFLERALSLFPIYDQLCESILQNLIQMGRQDVFPVLVQLKERANQDRQTALLRLADIAFIQKDLNRLAAIAKQSRKEITGFSGLPYIAGLVDFIKGQYVPAIEEFSRAIQLDPNYIEAYYYRGLCFKERGQELLNQMDSRRAVELKSHGIKERHAWPQDIILHFNSEWLLLKYQVTRRKS